MKAGEYSKMYAAESRFWWFVGKGLLVRSLAEEWFEPEGDYLDVGCGSGANLERMRGFGKWVGVDVSSEALGFCAERDHGLLALADASRSPFGDGVFVGAMALDLFEHLEEDGLAASELFRILRPGGRLIVTVPAHEILWGSHDVALGHVRRYSRCSLRLLLEGSGFRVLGINHFMGFLFPAMLVVKLWEKVFGDPGETRSYEWPDWLNRFLLFIVELEVSIFSRVRMPVGTTLVAVCERSR